MSRGAYADERPARADLRLFITGLGIGQICSWGSVYYSFPLIAEAMGRDLGWSKPDLYGAATIGLLLSGLAAYPVGSAIDRGHGRTIMAGASVLAGIFLIAWSQVESIAVFYILLAGIGCLQAAVLTEIAFAVVSRRFGAASARITLPHFSVSSLRSGSSLRIRRRLQKRCSITSSMVDFSIPTRVRCKSENLSSSR